MAGHSMGGMSAAGYAADHSDQVDGIILLAAYPTESLDDDLRLCSIYGSEDGCLDIEVYTESQSYWPEDSMETIIEGGNHAQFGDYGEQKGDGAAEISMEEQIKRTVECIQGI